MGGFNIGRKMQSIDRALFSKNGAKCLGVMAIYLIPFFYLCFMGYPLHGILLGAIVWFIAIAVLVD